MIYILGAGGMARETLSYYRDLRKFDEVAGFIEEGYSGKERTIDGKKINDAANIDPLDKDTKFIAAIGSPLKKRWVTIIEGLGCSFDTILHPSAVSGADVHIGEGCIICPGVVLTCDLTINKHSIVNISATINHDAQIGSFVTICPGVNIAGNVTVGDGCWIGIGATVIDNTKIGQGSYIGAGAVVTQDVPENVLALGIPAQPVKQMSEIDWKNLV